MFSRTSDSVPGDWTGAGGWRRKTPGQAPFPALPGPMAPSTWHHPRGTIHVARPLRSAVSGGFAGPTAPGLLVSSSPWALPWTSRHGAVHAGSQGGRCGAQPPGSVCMRSWNCSSGRRIFSSRLPAYSVAYHVSVDPRVLISFSEIQCSTCHAFRLHVALVCPPRRPPSCLLPTLHLRGSVLPDPSPGRPWNRPSLRGALLVVADPVRVGFLLRHMIWGLGIHAS